MLVMIGYAQQLPTYWTDDSGIDIYQESTIVHGGNYSVKMDVNTGSQSSCDFTDTALIPVTAGNQLAVHFWYQTSAHVHMRLVYDWVGASTGWGPYTETGASSWTELSDTVTVPSGATALMIRVRAYDVSGFSAPETQYLDDFTVESPLANFLTVPNGDFESWPSSPSTNQMQTVLSVNNDEIGILYSQPLSTIDATNYHLIDGVNDITFATATPLTTNDTILLSNPSQSIVADAVLDTLIDTSIPDSASFYAGILPISYTNSAYSTTIQNGYNFTVKALVTANDNYSNVWIQDSQNEFGGLMIYDNSLPNEVNVGDSIIIAGVKDVYNDLTEMKNPILLDIVNTGNTVTATTISASDLDTSLHSTLPAEKWEGQLVEIDNLTITEAGSYYYYGQAPDGSIVKVGDNVDYHFGSVSMDVGNTYNIIGVVDYYQGVYRINPRSMSDITLLANENHLTSAVSYDFSQLGGTLGVVAIHQDTINTIDVAQYILQPDNVTFSNGFFLEPDDHTFLALDNPNGTINSDNIVDSLIYLPYYDTVQFYAGILPVNYLNANDPNLIQDGLNATLKGTVIANDEYNQIWIRDAAEASHGILIYDQNQEYVGSLNVGDSIIVIGQRTVHNGMSEIIPMHIDSITQSADTIAIDIAASEIDKNLPQDDANGEKWEGQLVRVQGLTIVDYNSSYYEYTGVTSTGDSVIIDDDVDYHFGNISLTVGNTYNITGVVTYAYGAYKLNPRSMNDIEDVTPMTNSIEIATGLPMNSIVLQYTSKPTIDVSQIELHQGAGAGNITFAAYDYVDEPDSTVVIFYGASGTIADDNVVDTVYDYLNATSYEFYAGVLPVAFSNVANTDTVDMVHMGTYTGVVTANDNYNQVWINDGEGAYNGVLLYVDSNSDDSLLTLQVGDSVYVAGIRFEYNGLTELAPVFIVPILDSTVAHGHEVLVTDIEGSDINSTLGENDATAEPWEGQLVKISNVTVLSMDSSHFEYKVLTQSGDTVIIDDDVDYHYGSGLSLDIDSVYNITGVVTFAYGQYKLNPRGVDDVELVPQGTDIASVNSKISVYPNPVSDVLNVRGDVENIEIYNVYGQKQNVNYRNGQVNLNGLATGIYTVKILTSDGETISAKIIKK